MLKNILILALGFSIPLAAEQLKVANTQEQDLALLTELVMISSKTEDTEGVNRVQDRMAQELAQLGFQIQFVNNPGKDASGKPLVSGKQLIATYAGETAKYITLVTHADTVFLKLNPLTRSPDGKTLKGSGVGDAKGGFVVGLKAVKAILAQGKPRHSLRIVVSPSEETGSNGFQAELQKISQDSVAVFGLEPTMPDGSFITKRKGLTWYEVSVQGKAAHSGVAPQEGINACYDLSKKLTLAQELTDFSSGITVSIGKFGGGAPAANTVCPIANATLDSRYWTVEQGKTLAASIEGILAQNFAKAENTGELATTTFSVINATPPFDPASATAPFVDIYKKSILALEGRQVGSVPSGGGADLNFMNRPNLIAFDGLGPITRGTHTELEEIDISSLQSRAQALAELLAYTDKAL